MTFDSTAWSRLEAICDAALARRPDERTAFLARECGGDPAMLREAESLLAHATKADEFLSASALELAAYRFATEPSRFGIGDRVGPYDIRGLIGAGGMGQVYHAKDTKLGRDVALKILPDIFAGDPARAARLRREAQVLAALNHPHIGTIYGLDDVDGQIFLVLELIDGKTLAQRIKKKPLPLDQALPIARQIAEALEAAHEKGIVHRDLKPANVAITKDGLVKVLDFGLAKANDSSVVPAVEATEASALTEVGLIIGTAAYLSPEQAHGQPADKRSDMWAFGCVLYEMLTGQRAFDGKDSADVITAVVRGEPNWSILPARTPAPIRRLLRRCLERDRQRRLADAADARLEIDDAMAPLVPEAVSPKP
jgi:eukaryotic-like serine/threonine-protein kinase